MITEIEQLLYKHFCTVPFHNLNLLYGQPLQTPIPGGTCSDKSLAFLSDIRALGAEAFLHSANIGGKEIHRLVRIRLNKHVFFADVGSGWPMLSLLPSGKEVSIECYGMKYRTEVRSNWIRVFHTKQGRENLQLEINTAPRSEREILDQIKSRYSSGIDYPFTQSLRFSLVVGDEFLFLRGHHLERYSKTGFSVEELKRPLIPEIIEKIFGFNVSNYSAWKYMY
jgi:arylamine N-acetyltransferase